MELSDWAPEHSDALREHLAKGLSFLVVAKAINLKFNTAYSRSAVIGRATRMGLTGFERSKPTLPSHPPRLDEIAEHRAAESRPGGFHWPKPISENKESLKLRCVEIEPRHLSVIELERDDCRYPYGGDEDGEAITFCGHPRRPGSSYCTSHFSLSRDRADPAERAEKSLSLKVVEAA